jgi:sporulation protein YlmC with PRC-barrel domain
VPDPVAWKVVEPGWDVVASDGAEIGTVHEVVGDANADIFNGLHVSPGLLRSSRYVPAERVARIYEGRVELDLDEQAFGRLGEAEEAPPSAEIRADTTDLPDEDDPRAPA